LTATCNLIKSIRDGSVRVAGSVQIGRCRRCTRFSRFDSAARGQAAYDGVVYYVWRFRTIYLIQYGTNSAFRAELQ
jgi:hypothetical protein